jgi:hypothetical protein
MAKKTRRSYAELDNILGRHYADDNYCALVAVCIATNASAGKVKRYVEKFVKTWEGRKRVYRRGTPFEVIRAGLNRFGKEHDSDWNKDSHSGYTLHTVHKDLALKHPNDTFHVYVKGHVCCIREGILEDWTSKKPSRRKVTHVFRVIDRTS